MGLDNKLATEYVMDICFRHLSHCSVLAPPKIKGKYKGMGPTLNTAKRLNTIDFQNARQTM